MDRRRGEGTGDGGDAHRLVAHRLDGQQSTAGRDRSDEVNQDEVPGTQHVGAQIEVRGRDDVGGSVMAAEMPERRAIGISKDAEFNRVHNWVQDKANAILINASRMDEEFDGIATGLSSAITKDGQTTVTADLPMAGYKHTGVGLGSARNQYSTVGQVQDGATAYAVAGGTADALTLTTSPAITAYAAGQVFWSRLTADNATSTPTLAVCALAAKTIKKRGATTGQALAAGDLKAGNIAAFAYQSVTDTFELVTPARFGGLDTANTWSAVQTFSSGITFANETLSTYDEGTWTPGISFNGGSTGITYGVQVGTYTKVGKHVHVQGAVTLSNKGSSTAAPAAVTGFPFASEATSNNLSWLALGWSVITLSPSYTALGLRVPVNSTTFNLNQTGSGQTQTNIDETAFANTSNVQFGGTYNTAS